MWAWAVGTVAASVAAYLLGRRDARLKPEVVFAAPLPAGTLFVPTAPTTVVEPSEVDAQKVDDGNGR